MALATLADLEARLGRPITDPAEVTQAEAFLEDASALVFAYTRQTFELIEDDEVLLRPVGTWLRLPQRPVLAVTSVVAVGCAGQAVIPLAGFCWDGSDLINVDGLEGVVINLPEWWYDRDGPDSYRVVYDHGYAEIPAAVVGVVCAMVNRILTSPSPVEGLISERIGQYGYQMQQGTGAAGLAVRLTTADKEALAPWRRPNSTIALKVR